MSAAPNYAGPVDTATYGEYAIRRTPGDPRPLYRFTGRITADGSSGYRAEAGRYHLYAGWFCPWAQRVTIQRALNGLDDVVSVSYVDNERDGRGWAFRAEHGADPVNGFALLRDAYEATEPGFDGHVSVPTLWDRQTGRIVSNDFRTIGIDLATAFTGLGNGADTYPTDRRDRIEALDAWVGPAVNQGAGRAATDFDAWATLLDAFEGLEELLGTSRYLVGDEVTEADVRLFVTLVRYDAQLAGRRHSAPTLAEFPVLWNYARDLYRQPAFGSTTDFASFGGTSAPQEAWDEPPTRVEADEADGVDALDPLDDLSRTA